MKHRLTLTRTATNLVWSLISKIACDQNREMNGELIDEYFREHFNGSYGGMHHYRYQIMFDTAEDAIYFRLKFSGLEILMVEEIE